MKSNLTYFFEIYSLIHHLPLRSSKLIFGSNALLRFFFIFQLNCIQNHIHPLHLQQCTLDSPSRSNSKVHRYGRNNIQPKRFNKRIVNGSFAPHSEGSNHHPCPQRLVQVYVPNCLEQPKTEIAYYRHKSYRLCRNDKKKHQRAKFVRSQEQTRNCCPPEEVQFSARLKISRCISPQLHTVSSAGPIIELVPRVFRRLSGWRRLPPPPKRQKTL